MNINNLKLLPEDERPREKLLTKGARELSLIDLMAIILHSGIKGKSVLQLAQEVISLLDNEDIEDPVSVMAALKQLDGIGPAKIATIVATLELGKRLMRRQRPTKVHISMPYEVADYVRPYYQGEKQEYFSVLLLDTKRQIIAFIDIFKGSLDSSIVHPREIFHAAITRSASAIIAVHNHPSGNSNPSKEDILVTTRLVEAGQIMGIPLLDHIIIGDNNYTSLKQDGMIK